MPLTEELRVFTVIASEKGAVGLPAACRILREGGTALDAVEAAARAGRPDRQFLRRPERPARLGQPLLPLPRLADSLCVWLTDHSYRVREQAGRF